MRTIKGDVLYGKSLHLFDRQTFIPDVVMMYTCETTVDGHDGTHPSPFDRIDLIQPRPSHVVAGARLGKLFRDFLNFRSLEKFNSCNLRVATTIDFPNITTPRRHAVLSNQLFAHVSYISIFHLPDLQQQEERTQASKKASKKKMMRSPLKTIFRKSRKRPTSATKIAGVSGAYIWVSDNFMLTICVFR